jgi:hypothetical protein
MGQLHKVVSRLQLSAMPPAPFKQQFEDQGGLQEDNGKNGYDLPMILLPFCWLNRRLFVTIVEANGYQRSVAEVDGNGRFVEFVPDGPLMNAPRREITGTMG